VTRLCCGRDHDGPVCPDGLVMCTLCFYRFEQADLWTEDGTLWDICRECGSSEQGRHP
jgi:NMD protein affecting ribosome stability and mRNA decay